MLSLSSGMSAGRASDYFKKEDYYVRGHENSQWLGSGAASLGLSGEVRETAFMALAEGLHPSSGKTLVKGKASEKDGAEVRRAGNDATFSAPKSVSIAVAAGVEGMKQAHDNAVKTVMAHVEQHNSHVRIGGQRVESCVVAAKIDHLTSREAEPQLHSHVFIFNLGKAEGDDKWRANEPSSLFKDKMALGLIYRNELYNELTKAGHSLTITDRSKMYFELSGVDEKTIKDFSTRREQIETRVAELKQEGKDKGLTYSQLYERAALDTRGAKKEYTKEELHQQWKDQAELSGQSLKSIKESLAKEQQQQIEQPSTSEKAAVTVNDSIKTALDKLTDKEAVIHTNDVLKEAAIISGGQYSLSELRDALVTESIALGRDASGRECLTTSEMISLEKKNFEAVKELADKEFESQTTHEEVNAFLEKLEKEEGIILSAGQANHVRNELAGTSSLAVTQGDPGTGKTFAAGIVERFNSEVLEPSGRQHQTINVAFTGKAASEMAEASGQQAFTIDSFLLRYENDKVDISPGAQVVIKVDEASMVGARHAEKLLEVVKELQDQGITTKMLLQGDSKQMQAIQAGDFFRQATDISREKGDYAELKEITRQKDPELNAIAHLLNPEADKKIMAENGKEAIRQLNAQGRVLTAESPQELNQLTVDKYFEQTEKYSSVIIVTGMNSDRRTLNQMIREERMERQELSGEGNTYETWQAVNKDSGANSYNIGDKIVFSGWGAKNGTIATVLSVNNETNQVRAAYTYLDKEGNEKTVTKNYNAATLSQKTTTYELQDRTFAENDRIIFLKNNSELGVKNGTTGTVKGFDQEGKILVQTDDGKEVSVDANEYRYLDHGYAATVHKSQGQTVDSVIHHHLPENGMEASYNAINVAVTRCKYEATLITTDVEKLEEHAGRVYEKETTIDKETVDHLANLLQKSERENQQELISPELKTETPEQKTEQEAKREDQEQFIDQIEQEPEKESTQNDIELDL